MRVRVCVCVYLQCSSEDTHTQIQRWVLQAPLVLWKWVRRTPTASHCRLSALVCGQAAVKVPRWPVVGVGVGASRRRYGVATSLPLGGDSHDQVDHVYLKNIYIAKKE